MTLTGTRSGMRGRTGTSRRKSAASRRNIARAQMSRFRLKEPRSVGRVLRQRYGRSRVL